MTENSPAPPPVPSKKRPRSRWRRGRLGFLVALMLLVGAVRFVSHYWLDRRMGTGPAGPAVPREAFQSVWTRRPVLLVGVGDSVTAGFGASPGLSYFQRLSKNPPNEFPEMQGVSLSAVMPNLVAKNASVSGSTSPDHAKAQIPSLPVAPRETLGLVVMTTGGNDLIHNYGQTPPREGAMFGATLAQARPWIANFASRLDRMVADLERKFPGGVEIFLANIYDPTDGAGTAWVVGYPSWPDGLDIHKEYNLVLRAAAMRHPNVHLVDMHGAMLGHGFYSRQWWRPNYQKADPTCWYLDNFEDPNDRGYDAIRRAFLITIADNRERIIGEAE